MTKFKPVLLVVFCVAFVASEPLHYKRNNIDNISPRSHVKPSNYKSGYNPTSFNNQQLSAPIHSQPCPLGTSLPPPPQLQNSETFPLALSTVAPPSQKLSSSPFHSRINSLVRPTATPAPSPFRIEVFEPSYYAHPHPSKAEYLELAHLPPGPLPEQQYIEAGAQPPSSQPFIPSYSPFQQHSQTPAVVLPSPSLPPREPPFAALPATPRPRDCVQQKGGILIAEKPAYPIPAEIELSDNDAILVEAYSSPSASPPLSPQSVYPKPPSSSSPHSALLQKYYPAFPSPPSSPPQEKYSAFPSASIPPPPPCPQNLPARESGYIAYDVFSPSPSPSSAQPNYPAFSSPSIPPPTPCPQTIYPAFPSPSSPPQPQYQAFAYPSFPPPPPPSPQALPAQESDCVTYDYPALSYNLPFKTISHN